MLYKVFIFKIIHINFFVTYLFIICIWKKISILRSENSTKKFSKIKISFSANIMIDCSHANSNKDPALQPLVMENVTNQILEGNHSIMGLMVESHLGWGNQKIPEDRSQLKYGVSITDACIDWDTTLDAFHKMAEKLKPVLAQRRCAA